MDISMMFAVIWNKNANIPRITEAQARTRIDPFYYFCNEVANFRSANKKNTPGNMNASALIEMAEMNSKMRPISLTIIDRNTSPKYNERVANR